MVWNELTDNLEVLWAGLIAVGIVVLLTPAVGGMARLLGVVDRSEEGRRSTRARRAQARGPRALPRDLRALARLPRPEPRDARDPPRRRDRDHRRCDRRLPRPPLVGEARRTGRGRRVVVWAGVWVHRFTFPLLGVQELPKEVGMTLTVVGIVAVMNMVNFLDGLDGLAAGVCAISAFSFCVIGLSRGDINAAIITAAVLGGCLGFLRHNFYPARIFMGDSGALLLGFTLAAVSVQGLSKTAALTALVLPLLVLAVPLIDTSFVVAKRIKHGRPVYVADRTHLHHRFENIGFSQRRSVVYLYAWCATLALAALATRFVHPHRHGHWDSRQRRDRRCDRPARDRRLALRRLPARDREAREPVHPPARRGASARARAPK